MASFLGTHGHFWEHFTSHNLETLEVILNHGYHYLLSVHYL